MLQESEGQERVTDKSFPPHDASLYVTHRVPSSTRVLWGTRSCCGAKPRRLLTRAQSVRSLPRRFCGKP